jgi:hypothetical protein
MRRFCAGVLIVWTALVAGWLTAEPSPGSLECQQSDFGWAWMHQGLDPLRHCLTWDSMRIHLGVAGRPFALPNQDPVRPEFLASAAPTRLTEDPEPFGDRHPPRSSIGQ